MYQRAAGGASSTMRGIPMQARADLVHWRPVRLTTQTRSAEQLIYVVLDSAPAGTATGRVPDAGVGGRSRAGSREWPGVTCLQSSRLRGSSGGRHKSLPPGAHSEQGGSISVAAGRLVSAASGHDTYPSRRIRPDGATQAGGAT